VIAGTLIALALPASASAASRKVGIGDFQWSLGEVHVDRGDSVTWYWIGPDTQHSVTGQTANAKAIDSDPRRTPEHAVDDRFKVTFDQPGVYEFQCKLHAIVRGTVTVTSAQGTGAPSPDADPQPAIDFTPPELTDARWSTTRMKTGAGAELDYTLDEPARIVFDVLQKRHGRWRLRGTKRFHGHIGYNHWDFGGALRHRRVKPGRYRGLLVAIDAEGNRTKDVRAPFRVVGPKKHKQRK
jgi:plastocyanin